ncbi:MAG: transporter [Lachnospiraceae bacterium]|nr:transporter [Lachnospiraceae bacterium]
MKGILDLKKIAFLQLAVIIYTLSGVAAKQAALYDAMTPGFLFYYGVEIIILGIYALIWQQLIKRIDLSIAYANRSMAILWSMIWAVIFFGEIITIKNMIGVAIVLAGTMIINSDDE